MRGGLPQYAKVNIVEEKAQRGVYDCEYETGLTGVATDLICRRADHPPRSIGVYRRSGQM